MPHILNTLFYRFSKSITIAAVLCIIAFQALWLYSDFKSRKKQLLKEVEVAYTSQAAFHFLSHIEPLFNQKLDTNTTTDAGQIMQILKQFQAVAGAQVYVSVDSIEDKIEIPDELKTITRDLDLSNSSSRKELRDKIKAEIEKINPDLTFQFFPNDSNISFYGNDSIFSHYHIHGMNKVQGILLGNTTPVILSRMKLSIFLSFLYLSLCLGALIILYNSLRKQQRLIALKKSFTQGMTHELKTPLSILSLIRESIEMAIAQGSLNITGYLATMKTEVSKLDKLVDDILVHDKLDTSTLVMSFKTIRLIDILEDVQTRMQPKITAAEGKLNLQVGSALQVRCDREHFSNVFVNLIDNALKYNSEKPIITISAVTYMGQIKIECSDNGIGIDPTYIPHIFESYFRVPTANLYKKPGYGLGLSYVKQIIELHKGKISVSNKSNTSGCIFTIELPN